MSKRKQRRLLVELGQHILFVAIVGAFFLLMMTACEAEDALKAKAADAEVVQKPVLYDVPLEDALQLYIADLCEEHHMEPKLVLAVIQKESTFKADAVGDNGNSLGLMQIQPRWHQERMKRLGCTDLLDPYENVKVGIDILAEKLEQYSDTEMALMVYNAGTTGAYSNWFKYGISSNEYSQTVLAYMDALVVREGGENMNIPDNYDVWLSHEEHLEAELAKRPVCHYCEDHIQEEFYYEINGEIICEHCLDLLFKKEVIDE